MCKVQMLRALVKQRLAAAADEIFGLFERTIAEYEEELCRSREENERHRKLLDAVFKPQLRIRRADVQQQLVVKEEVPPEQQDPEPPPHIKEEQEELWSSHEGEHLEGLEEADITKFTFTPVPVKSEDDEEKRQSLLLHQRQTEHMETEADGEDCGGPEAARNSDPERHLHPDTEDKTGDSSETDDSDDWKESREPPSGSNSVCDFRSSAGEKPFRWSMCKKYFAHSGDLHKRMKIHTGEKPFSCSVCKKSFTHSGDLHKHMRTHTGKKPFSCPVCDRRFTLKAHLKPHMRIHTAEKPFSCNVCDKRFARHHQVKTHKCFGRQSSQLHQSQTEENREAEPPASSSTEHMETEADGEDCGGPEAARISDPERHLHPDTEDKTGDYSETEDSDDWKESREPPSGSNSVSDSRCSTGEKPFSCSECGKRFGRKENLKRHILTHTGEKPFSCSVCKKSFAQGSHLHKHMITHTGEKPFSCSVCDKRFSFKGNLIPHMRIHTGEKPISCSECGKKFCNKGDRNRHILTHTGKKPFSCSVCKKYFTQSGSLKEHMRIHTGEKPFSCSVCNKTFGWRRLVKKHKCVGRQSSQLHQTQTEENREAEPPASSSTEHMETGANGEDCGGPEAARNSDPERHLHPDTEDKTGDSSETKDSDEWKESREPLSGSNSLANEEVPVSDSRSSPGEKPFSCSDCGKRFGRKRNLKLHMITHTGEKPFSCSECDKRFSLKQSLVCHLKTHSEEKPSSCTDGETSGGPEPAVKLNELLQ